MPIRNRRTLKECFRQGKKPDEQDFENLIDSTLNILDDGFSKSPETGIGLSPLLEKGTVMSVFQEPADPQPKWEIAIDPKGSLIISRFSKDGNLPAITLNTDGSVVLGEELKNIEIKGALKMPSREGSFLKGKVPANGKWHDISEELYGCYALEIVASAGKRGSGKHAVLVATTTTCFGRNSKISKIRSYYGMYGYKIRIRWKKCKHKNKLQLRTIFKYDNETQIEYHVTSLIKG